MISQRPRLSPQIPPRCEAAVRTSMSLRFQSVMAALLAVINLARQIDSEDRQPSQCVAQIAWRRRPNRPINLQATVTHSLSRVSGTSSQKSVRLTPPNIRQMERRENYLGIHLDMNDFDISYSKSLLLVQYDYRIIRSQEYSMV